LTYLTSYGVIPVYDISLATVSTGVFLDIIFSNFWDRLTK
jgi:hypothetical protein